MVKKAFYAFALLAGSQVHAATASATFQVSLTVLAACSVTATNLDFGSVPALSTGNNIDSANQINVTCSSGTPYSVSLNSGLHSSGVARRLSNGTAFVSYELYSDSSRTSVWTVVNGGVGTGNVQVLPVYGRVPGTQVLADPGQFSDTITVTISY